jgi:tRNA(fMet)-specific endonuclease VapC
VKYLLDTNICIFLIKRRPPKVLRRFQLHSTDEIAVSSVTLAELRYGADKSTRSIQAHQALDEFLTPLAVVDFDGLAAGHYGKIRAALERQGTPIGSLDMLIAAHALSLGVTLVTNNVSEYSRVSGLAIEDWAGA